VKRATLSVGRKEEHVAGMVNGPEALPVLASAVEIQEDHFMDSALVGSSNTTTQ